MTYIYQNEQNRSMAFIMNYHLSGVLKKTSDIKLLIRKRLCSVCLCYRSSSLFIANYCCSLLTKHHKRHVCDTCVHQHILSKLYSCLTSSIQCPEINCTINYSQSIICEILLKYNSNQLLDDYLCEQQWQGKSHQWIERFAVRCPCCYVPIEKNGGCDEMICTQCQTHFYWSIAKRNSYTNKKQEYDNFYIIHPFIDGIIIVITILVLILSTVIYFK